MNAHRYEEMAADARDAQRENVALRRERDEARAEVAALREAIRNAPHRPGCARIAATADGEGSCICGVGSWSNWVLNAAAPSTGKGGDDG